MHHMNNIKIVVSKLPSAWTRLEYLTFHIHFKKKTWHGFIQNRQVLIVGDFGTDLSRREEKIKYGQRESNLEGMYNKTVRVFFLPKFSTLQLEGSIGIELKWLELIASSRLLMGQA